MSFSNPSTYHGLLTVQDSAITVFPKSGHLTPEHEQRLIDQLVPEHAQHLIPINRRDNTLLELLFQDYNAILQAAGADETRIDLHPLIGPGRMRPAYFSPPGGGRTPVA